MARVVEVVVITRRGLQLPAVGETRKRKCPVSCLGVTRSNKSGTGDLGLIGQRSAALLLYHRPQDSADSLVSH